MFTGPLTESILQRAQEKEILTIDLHDLRTFGKGRYRQVDDAPYGGGAGMVLMCEPVVTAIDHISKRKTKNEKRTNVPHRIYLTPGGKRLTQARVEQLAKKKWLLLICGHYEGIDQRVIDGWTDEEISIGDYVLTGGEIPAMVLIDAVARHLPGVLGKEESGSEESFSKTLGRKREYPHYTRPEVYRGKRVPTVLLSGNHQEIARWRKAHLQ